MPLAEVFYGMTAKGYGMAEVLREMNAKLKRILPVDMFCCAVLLNLSMQCGAVEVWNGGMPDVTTSLDGQVLSVQSRHLPLGILAAERFDASTEMLPLVPAPVPAVGRGAGNADEQERLFGERRLREVLNANRDPACLFDELLLALERLEGTRATISACAISACSVPRAATDAGGLR